MANETKKRFLHWEEGQRKMEWRKFTGLAADLSCYRSQLQQTM
jgi:hypothetical protein